MLFEDINEEINATQNWAQRRQLGIPTNKRLMVVACMDERLNVEEALDLSPGDAHIVRNAGGVVTDDVMRSALFCIHFAGAEEIIVVNHTDCGLCGGSIDKVQTKLGSQGVFLDTCDIDPALPGLKIPNGDAHRWFKFFEDVDEACVEQVNLLKNHPFIPDHVKINGYIWEVESMRLRRPGEKISK